MLFLLLPLALLAFMFISQRRRQREVAERQQSVRVGDEVVTTAGLFARVVTLDAGTVTLEASPGVLLRFDRRAIARIVPAPTEEYAEPAGSADLGRPGATVAEDPAHRSRPQDGPPAAPPAGR